MKGNDIFKNLRNAVVMAHVYRKNAEPLTLVYAPVGFDQVFDYDTQLQRRKFIHILLSVLVVIVVFGLVTYLILNFSKYKSQKNFEQSHKDYENKVRTHGIVM